MNKIWMGLSLIGFRNRDEVPLLLLHKHVAQPVKVRVPAQHGKLLDAKLWPRRDRDDRVPMSIRNDQHSRTLLQFLPRRT